MNAARAHQRANPLSKAAEILPAAAWTAITVAATLAAVAFAFLYAYNQDTLFPERHFPRTWVLVSVMSAVGVLALVPPVLSRTWLATAAGSLGAGMLVFGGANLANKAPGVVVLVAGAIAWLAFAAAAERRGQSPGAVVAGLFAAAPLTFVVVGICVVAVSGSS